MISISICIDMPHWIALYNKRYLKKDFMEKKPVKPSEIPVPSNPEIVPSILPEEPLLPGTPEIFPEKDPTEPAPPTEIPQPEQ